VWRGTIVWIEAVEESVEVEVSVVSSTGSSGKEGRGGRRDSRARSKSDGWSIKFQQREFKNVRLEMGLCLGQDNSLIFN
jgi:hypothetical protein